MEENMFNHNKEYINFKKMSNCLSISVYILFFVLAILLISFNIVQAEKVEIVQHDISTEKLNNSGVIDAEIKVKNHQQKTDLWIGYSIRDSQGKWYDLEPQNLTMEPDSTQVINFEDFVFPKKEISPGDFLFVTALWDIYPQEEAYRLTEDRKQKEINFEHSEPEEESNKGDLRIDFIDYNFFKATHRLGRGRLDPDNIIQEDEIIKIISPANSYQGGEIRTEKYFGYGSYRVEMKTDYAPGSFAAFFLYEDVKGDNDEIDIEIYNDGSGQIDFVTFTQGEKTNYKIKELPFDPASDYHEYRIDYFPEKILFYVEDELMAAFNSQLPSAKMKVMINHWWPNWLEADKDHQASEIQIREIDLQEF